MRTSEVSVGVASDDLQQAWDRFIGARPEADFLQAWPWGEVARESAEEPVRLVARTAEGRIRGVAQILVRRTALGRTVAYVPHGPIWERDAPDGDAVLAALLDGLRREGRRRRAIVVKVDPRGDGTSDETRAALRDRLLHAGLRPAREDLQAVTTRVVDLGGDREALFGGWTANARRDLRRAIREGVVTAVIRSIDPAAIEAFSRLWDETAARSAFNRRSTDFLHHVADGFAPAGQWLLVLASRAGQPLGGLVALRVGDRGYYVYAASSRDPAAKHASPGYVAMAGLMEALVDDGVRSLDLWGVAEPGSEHAEADWAGFSFFKLRFGGAPVTHTGTFDLVITPALYAVRDLFERLRSPRRA